MPISKTVWRKGWKREAAATQAAAADLAVFIGKLELHGLEADAEIFRRAAMKHGAGDAMAIVRAALRDWVARREVGMTTARNPGAHE